jgi:hypothetical protein
MLLFSCWVNLYLCDFYFGAISSPTRTTTRPDPFSRGYSRPAIYLGMGRCDGESQERSVTRDGGRRGLGRFGGVGGTGR